MVFLQSVLLRQGGKAIKKAKFLDTLLFRVQAGSGGNGLPKYGGIGGQGGCVYFVAKEKYSLKKTLASLPPGHVVKAGNGEESSKLRLIGRRGQDTELIVPTGLTVIDAEKNLKLGELNEEGETIKVAGGGGGGCTGNNFIGVKGQERLLNLDLKLIADVGLVGFPNAGKSTFLKAISNAKPRIASYPFTTIMPNIGVIEYPDLRKISIADLPGLIEGAHRNIGLGHKFLKHVERTKILLLIVDVFGFQMSQRHLRRNCLENIYSLNKELELYDPSLLDKPAILLINKLDLEGSEEEFEKYEKFIYDLKEGLNQCPSELIPDKLLTFDKILTISAKRVKEIDQVKEAIRKILDLEAERQLLDSGQDDSGETRKKLIEYGPRVV